MYELRKIDDKLCDKILSTYPSNPLIRSTHPNDMCKLLKSSIYASAHNKDVMSLGKPLTSLALRAAFKPNQLIDVFIPILLLEGKVLFRLHSSNLIASIDAPFLTYFYTRGFSATSTYFDYGVSAKTKGVIFSPESFKYTLSKNPNMYDTIIEDRERIIELAHRWASLNSLPKPELRIARYLFAKAPIKYERIEVVHLTQSNIAETLGYSRATVAKAISSLHDGGIIETGHGKIIVNMARLRKYITQA